MACACGRDCTLPNQDVIDFRVIDWAPGQMASACAIRTLSWNGDHLETVNIDPTGYDTIMLRLAGWTLGAMQ